MAEGKTNMFGKTYNTIGSTDSNFIIKTKGDLKILWGNKFIDLIKNGKISSNSELIFKIVDTENDIKGDGIYLINGQLWISLNGNNFKIIQDVTSNNGTMFVSYDLELKVTNSLKYKALTNIGLYYKTLNDVQGVNSGIVYIEETQKLYTITNGIIKPYIVQSEKETQVVTNEFNELRVGPLHLYSQEGFGIINSDIDMILSSLGIPYIILDDGIKFQQSILIDDSKEIKSKGATEKVGYRLYIENGLSTLEIDNLIQRHYPLHITYNKLMEMIENKELLPKMYYLISDFQNPWEVSWSNESLYYLDKLREINGVQYTTEIRNAMLLIVLATSNNTISTQVWDPLNPTWIIHYDPYYKGKEWSVNDTTLYGFRSREGLYLSCKGKITYLKDEYNNEGNFNFRHLRFKRGNNWNYCMDSKKSQFGEFLIGQNNKFQFENVNTVVLVFKCESVLDNAGNIIGYNTKVYDSDIEISNGNNILINSVINNNTFIFKESQNNIQHTIEEECTIENNHFENISQLQIVKGSSVKNNIIKNTECSIDGICENNNINNITKLQIFPKQKVINNIIDTVTISLYNNQEGIIQNNTIKNSKIIISNTSNINNNIIEDCENLNIINTLLLENNTIKSVLKITNNSTAKNNILTNITKEFINSGTFSNNIISNTGTINNSGKFDNNNIKQAQQLANTGLLLNNIINIVQSNISNSLEMINNVIETIDTIRNNGYFNNNNIKVIKVINSEYNNTISEDYKWINNTINTITNAIIRKNLINNKINTIDSCVINENFENNIIELEIISSNFNGDVVDNIITKNIENTSFGVFKGNIINGNIKNSNFQLFTNNEVKRDIEVFRSEIVNECVFNKTIKYFTTLELLSCNFDYIEDLKLLGDVKNATFHGNIGGELTRPLNTNAYKLLENSSKKDVYPNIRIVSVPDMFIKGMIMMWDGSADIPSGWAMCDGRDGRPDLIDRFIKGGKKVGPVNPEGVNDDNTVLLALENIPEHSHPHMPHTHEMTLLKGYTDNSGPLSVLGRILQYHSTMYAVGDVSSSEVLIHTSDIPSGYYYTEANTTYRGGNHSHNVTITGGAILESTSIENKLNWGPRKPIKIEPKHYVLIFIIKIDDY